MIQEITGAFTQFPLPYFSIPSAGIVTLIIASLWVFREKVGVRRALGLTIATLLIYLYGFSNLIEMLMSGVVGAFVALEVKKIKGEMMSGAKEVYQGEEE